MSAADDASMELSQEASQQVTSTQSVPNMVSSASVTTYNYYLVGWVPQTFKSSRQERAEQVQNRAEDFMDDEVCVALSAFNLGIFRILVNLESLHNDCIRSAISWKLWVYLVAASSLHGSVQQ